MATKKYNIYGEEGTGSDYIYTTNPKSVPKLEPTLANIYDTTKEPLQNFNDAGLAKMAQDQTTNWYTGGGKFDAAYVYDQIQKEKENYNKASIAGDRAAMDAAHQRAEAWRATAGYSGGHDGSQMIELGGAGIGAMGVSGTTKPTTPGGGYYDDTDNGGWYSYYVDYGPQTPEAQPPSAGYESIKSSAMGVNQSADDIARQLYINYMQNTNRNNELMGMSGLQGSGMQESSLIGMNNNYQNLLYQNERARAQDQQTLRTQIASMLAAGEISQAEADALYAGLSGGDYTIAAPEPVSTGGYVSYYVPGEKTAVSYSNPNGAYIPQGDANTGATMTDAEMYYVLRSAGLSDQMIDAYFTPGVKAPTLEAVIADQAAAKARQQAAMQPVVEPVTPPATTGTGTTGTGNTKTLDDLPKTTGAGVLPIARNGVYAVLDSAYANGVYAGERAAAEAIQRGELTVEQYIAYINEMRPENVAKALNAYNYIDNLANRTFSQGVLDTEIANAIFNGRITENDYMNWAKLNGDKIDPIPQRLLQETARTAVTGFELGNANLNFTPIYNQLDMWYAQNTPEEFNRLAREALARNQVTSDQLLEWMQSRGVYTNLK